MNRHPLPPFAFNSSRENDQPLRPPILLPKSDEDAVTAVEELVRKRLHHQDESVEKYKRRTLDSSSVVNSDALMSDDSLHNGHSSIAQSIVYRTSSRQSIASSDRGYFFQRVPSSPPSAINNISSSPTRPEFQEDELMTSQATMVPSHYESDDDSDSTVDFNVNRLNKINGYISSDFLMSEPSYFINDEDVNIEAKGRIAVCIDDGCPKLHLEGIGLKILPDDVEDLKNMVCFGVNGVEPPKIEIYATHNKLRILPPGLFNVVQLHVLSLRGNKLKKLPGIIWKLKNLTDLSLVNNEIKVLPYQILKLPKLTNLLVRPNLGLIELKDQDPLSYFCVADAITNQDVDVCRYVSRVKWSHLSSICGDITDLEIAKTISAVPKLMELALRRFCHYDVTLSETRLWKRTIPVYTQKMITKALQKGIYNEGCSVCDTVTVNPVAKAIEWWDFRAQSLVPVRRNFCCGQCVTRWIVETDAKIANHLSTTNC